VEWVLGHSDIEGNELADSYAKEATQGTISSPHLLPHSLQSPPPKSTAALKETWKQNTKPTWLAAWKKSPRYVKMTWIDPHMPGNRHSEPSPTFCTEPPTFSLNYTPAMSP